MWWRIWIPTWRFFNRVGSRIEIWKLENDQWIKLNERPTLHWYSLFFNPQTNYFHALNNLVERAVVELSTDSIHPSESVSLAILRDIYSNHDLKISLDGEDILTIARIQQQ